jgi:DNA topoisomerase-3
LREAWPRLSSDEKKLFDIIARAYLAALITSRKFHNSELVAWVPRGEQKKSCRGPRGGT